ncbi:MAG: PEP-CTERM sorting domain-containing protein [Pirellulales bacterium]|nr:PEP-CTERM sorting domain-containing protein [Pirellulales bacterium]
MEIRIFSFDKRFGPVYLVPYLPDGADRVFGLSAACGGVADRIRARDSKASSDSDAAPVASDKTQRLFPSFGVLPMKKFAILSVALAVLGFATTKSFAAPTPVNLTLTGSNILLTIDALGAITATVGFNPTGSQNITLDDCDPIATSMTFDGGLFNLSDQTLLLNLGALGVIRTGFIGVKIGGLSSTGSIPLNYLGGTWNYSFDPGDPNGGNVTSAAINQGILTYAGSGAIALLLGSGTLDFNTDPVVADLPSLGQIGSLQQTFLGASGGSTTYGVLLSAPLSVFTAIDTDLGINATLQGLVQATGTYICVPEPSTVVLLGVALAALVPMYRRIKK